jgi:hypothetical protein
LPKFRFRNSYCRFSREPVAFSQSWKQLLFTIVRHQSLLPYLYLGRWPAYDESLSAKKEVKRNIILDDIIFNQYSLCTSDQVEKNQQRSVTDKINWGRAQTFILPFFSFLVLSMPFITSYLHQYHAFAPSIYKLIEGYVWKIWDLLLSCSVSKVSCKQSHSFFDFSEPMKDFQLK